MYRVAVCLLLAVFFPTMLFAHATGVSLEKEAGAYLVDVGYNPPQLYQGDRAVFDFNLKKNTGDKEVVPFDYVWVRVENNKQTLLATGIARADFGPTTLLFQLPAGIEGDIVLNARYQKGEDALAEAEFTLPVSKVKTTPWTLIFVGVAGFVLGAGGMHTASRFFRPLA